MHNESEWLPAKIHSVPDLNKAYYVIIGLGFSALVNYMTLISSNPERVENLPILFIGEWDPWQRYSPTRMGQWPAMLTLPGFEFTPSGDETDFLPSQEFAAVLRKQWLNLSQRGDIHVMMGQVTRVARSGRFFAVDVMSKGRKYKVKAGGLDICGGPGPSNRIERSIVPNDGVWQEYLYPANAGHFPRLVAAEDYLRADIPRAESGGVLVYGGSPTGAWCVETALAHKNSVIFVARDGLDGAFVPSGRNDHLAEPPIDHAELWPTQNQPLTFAEHYSLTALHVRGKQILARFKKNPDARYVQKRMPSIPDLESERISQVVVAIGQDQNYWETLLRQVLARDLDRKFLVDRFGRIVGLQSDDGRCRLLGSAAFGSGTFKQIPMDHPSRLYNDSLPSQGQEPRNIVYSAVAIAEANLAWNKHNPNRNVNTAHRGELTDAIALRSGAAPLLAQIEAWPYRDRYLVRRSGDHSRSPGSELKSDDGL
ncbi:MAG: hypothetical protein U0R19_04615 [Bryobacteraceae bacterium]